MLLQYVCVMYVPGYVMGHAWVVLQYICTGIHDIDTTIEYLLEYCNTEYTCTRYSEYTCTYTRSSGHTGIGRGIVTKMVAKCYPECWFFCFGAGDNFERLCYCLWT